MSAAPLNPGAAGAGEVLGFDLGHGESAVARAPLTSDAPAEMLEIGGRKSIVTAIGTHPKRGPVIGEAAVIDPAVTDGQLGFKGSPLGRPGEPPVRTAERNELSRRFFKGVMSTLVAEKRLSPGDARIYVGCPSSWLPRTEGLGHAAGHPEDGSARDAYRELLRAAGHPGVEVVAESRGAFLHAMETGRLTIGELESAVLVIDIGSSTTDFTLVHDLRDSPVDFGHPGLGASLIDAAILRRTLEAQPGRAELEDVLRRFPFLSARLELACRRAKEAYFSDEDSFQDPAMPLVRSENIQRQFHVDIVLDGRTMDAILDEPQPALDGLSWRACFRDALVQAKRHLDERGVRLAALLLTGGASRMRFTRALCEEVFPEARFQPDSSPEFCIAMGLAYVGRYEVRTAGFMEEIEALCASDRLAGLMRGRVADLVDALAAPVAAGLIEHAFKPAIGQWRDGSVRTLRELEVGPGGEPAQGRIAQLARAWLASDAAREAVGRSAVRWLDLIQADLQRDVDRLCARYRVPAGALRVEVAPDARELLRGPLPGVDPASLNFIGAVVGIVVAVVIASLLGGGGIALLMHGPMGWLVGLAIGAGAAFLGVEKAKDLVRTADLPLPVRAAPFAVQSLEGRVRDMEPQVRAAVREQLASRPEAFGALFDAIRARVREELLAKAQRVRVFIGVGVTPGR